MWEHIGMARDAKGLQEAIQMLKDLKKEFWSNVFIPGNADNLNTELEKALRVADFIEIGTLMAHDALDRSTRQKKVRPCVMTISSCTYLAGSTKARTKILSC